VALQLTNEGENIYNLVKAHLTSNFSTATGGVTSTVENENSTYWHLCSGGGGDSDTLSKCTNRRKGFPMKIKCEDGGQVSKRCKF
jgi:hypothetical protein